MQGERTKQIMITLRLWFNLFIKPYFALSFHIIMEKYLDPKPLIFNREIGHFKKENQIYSLLHKQTLKV